MPPPNYHKAQLLFVKNVPQESTQSIAQLYAQFAPLSMKNLFSDGRITTMMFVLPSAEIAATAHERTDGLRVDSTIISVERYNAKQSTVARREVRRRQRGGQGRGDEDECDEYDGYDECEVEEEVPESWEDEYVPEKSFAIGGEAGKQDGVSWADVTKGVPRKTPSPLLATPAVDALKATVDTSTLEQLSKGELSAASHLSTLTDKSSRSPPPSNGNCLSTHENTPAQPAPATGPIDAPQIKVTPATVVLLRGQLPQQPSSSMPSLPHSLTAPQGSTPTERSESEDADEDYSQATLIPDFKQQQRGTLASSTDTTAVLRSRHCTACTFCKLREQWRMSG
ncbi:hypothetical protein EJ07DRAFT_183866 [Lizonia empirigonia]|nr:hypothetical protein EJ07DRAFT_183866 [Lizonia empirigonia]